jgi:fatty-acyl-CoA synthase
MVISDRMHTCKLWAAELSKGFLMNSSSYVCGLASEPLLYKTIGQALEDTARAHPNNEALVDCQQNIRLTYAQLEQAVNNVAGNLHALDIVKGDRVGIWSPNNAEWVLTQLACARIGAVLVTINPAYRLSELEYVLNKVSCNTLVVADSFKSSDYLGMLGELAPEINASKAGELQAAKIPALRNIIHLGQDDVPGMFCFSEFEKPVNEDVIRALEQLAAELQPDDPINIQFTSGTTGFPKGATLTHCNILNNGYFVAETMQFTEKDRLCIPVPLYHCFGMVMGVLGCLTHGSTMVFPDEAFEPESVLSVVQAERCTALYGVPTMFIAELAHPAFANYDLSSLRTGIMAGATCPRTTMESVMQDMHMSDVTIAYGMTETSPVSFQTGVGDPVDKRVATVGRVHPHVQVKLVDEEGKVVEKGQQGELCTRGYSVMLGYWGDDELTAESIDRAGWMHTGDLAVMDEDGYCDIVGRVKDMIIRGGENVYPREIEEYLLRHPGVQDASVFGVPDKKFGEQVAVWIMPKVGMEITEDSVREFCDGQIAHYKIPHYVRFVDEFPMTVTGKIQKFVMRNKLSEELGLHQGDSPA